MEGGFVSKFNFRRFPSRPHLCTLLSRYGKKLSKLYPVILMHDSPSFASTVCKRTLSVLQDDGCTLPCCYCSLAGFSLDRSCAGYQDHRNCKFQVALFLTGLTSTTARRLGLLAFASAVFSCWSVSKKQLVRTSCRLPYLVVCNGRREAFLQHALLIGHSSAVACELVDFM